MNNTSSFVSIFSQGETPQQAIAECEKQLAGHAGHYNFGFIYATDEMSANFPELIRQCKQSSGIQHWLGTIGIGVISPAKESYEIPAVSIMLAQFDEDEFTLLPSVSTIEKIPDVLHWPHSFIQNFGIVHVDPYHQRSPELIEALGNAIDNGFLVGGLTSSNSFQYQVADKVDSGGISGVLFSEKIGVLTSLSQGCSPIGEKHHINRAERNIAHTLDKRPALDVLMADMGITNQNELQEKAEDVFTGLCIPGSDQSDYTVRNLIGVDFENKVFAINDYVTEGNDLIFCTRNEKTAVDDMQAMLDRLALRLKGSTPKGGIYISCLGRGREQFGPDSEEIKMIHATLGDFPLTGFFANGEIHHNRIYGYTGVLTLFT